MKNENSAKHIKYLILFLLLVAIEVLIALFVHDSFIRPYVGNVIVVGVIYCFVRSIFPDKIKLLPLYVFLFATAIDELKSSFKSIGGKLSQINDLFDAACLAINARNGIMYGFKSIPKKPSSDSTGLPMQIIVADAEGVV